MEHNRQIFLSFWSISFCHEKLKKKTIGDIIVLQMCTINDNHMMYGS